MLHPDESRTFANDSIASRKHKRSSVNDSRNGRDSGNESENDNHNGEISTFLRAEKRKRVSSMKDGSHSFFKSVEMPPASIEVEKAVLTDTAATFTLDSNLAHSSEFPLSNAEIIERSIRQFDKENAVLDAARETLLALHCHLQREEQLLRDTLHGTLPTLHQDTGRKTDPQKMEARCYEQSLFTVDDDDDDSCTDEYEGMGVVAGLTSSSLLSSCSSASSSPSPLPSLIDE